MDLGIAGKIFIVTGGAKGIGFAIARALGHEGASVMIVGRNSEDNQRSLLMLREEGIAADAIAAELGDVSLSAGIIRQTLAVFGRIDGLINNAGANDGVSLREGSADLFLKSLQNNLVHYYALAHEAIPYIIREGGCIINIGSKVAETGQGKTSGYAAAKGAIHALTREWAAELASTGVRVNAVIPAEAWTPLYENWIQSFPEPQEKLQDIVRHIPLGKRMTTAEEIASMVVFLCSPLSAHTTGQLIFVDGGYTHLDRALT